MKASFAGFAPFASPAIQLAAGQVKRVDISMALEVEQQSVTVTDDAPNVSVEAGGNSDAVMLKGKDLDALSDDPDELSNELTALAGPSAGPNGGQIYIDGFSGGQLPPKSAIREIRINQNPFSAEFDQIGYGRIDILMKPGTDQLHGQFFIQGNDKAFNTGNPFTTVIPPYYSYQYNGTLSGALSKSASFSVSAEQRNTQNVNTWSIPDAILDNSSGSYANCPIPDPNIGPYVDCQNFGVNLLNQRVRDNASARIDWQLGARNTLTARYGFWSESEHHDLNQNSLASASTHESNTDHTVQVSDAIVINDHAVNETRFQYERQNKDVAPPQTPGSSPRPPRQSTRSAAGGSSWAWERATLGAERTASACPRTTSTEQIEVTSRSSSRSCAPVARTSSATTTWPATCSSSRRARARVASRSSSPATARRATATRPALPSIWSCHGTGAATSGS